MIEKWSFRLSEEAQRSNSCCICFQRLNSRRKRLMSNKTDVVSCHYQSEYWNSRSRVADSSTKFADVSRTNSQSEPTSLSQSQNNHTVNQMIRNHSLNNIALIFWSTASVIDRCAHLSRQWDSEFDVFCSQAHAAYKCKTDKVQSVDQADLSKECSIHVINWKEKILKKD
jgi:hypothetical protein